MNQYTLNNFKMLVQNVFDKNDIALQDTGHTTENQIKAHLVENNYDNDIPSIAGFSDWAPLHDAKKWYFAIKKDEYGDIKTIYIDTSRDRVWIVYSLMSASEFDNIILKWTHHSGKLDKCWLSRNQLLSFGKYENWTEKGIGIKFNDGLSTEENKGKFSLKAWYAPESNPLQELLKTAKDNYAIESIRWQKYNGSNVDIVSEWYSHGKVTINRAISVDDVLLSISDMANHYQDSLINATKLRDQKMNAFELNFSRDINLEAFSDVVSNGRTKMNLWLTEIESESNFKRFRGVDLHTWDSIFMDVGPDYAYLTVPGKGCVNAAPRIATLQGQENAGKTNIYFDGVEVFD